MNLFNNYKSGTVISVPKPPFTHFGILVFNFLGEPFVISNSFRKEKVVIETLEKFCSGYKPKTHNMWGKYTRQQIVERAKSLLGTPYSAAKYNCEHFVRDVHGLSVESPQFNNIFGLALVSGISYFLLKKS